MTEKMMSETPAKSKFGQKDIEGHDLDRFDKENGFPEGPGKLDQIGSNGGSTGDLKNREVEDELDGAM